jgi:predicted ATP-binding protein involved in virulence
MKKRPLSIKAVFGQKIIEMRITKLQLQNFKRFTDLTISLDKPYKLVLLVGSNGSGKSSVFDAFEVISTHEKNENAYKKTYDRAYHVKNQNGNFKITIETDKLNHTLTSDIQVFSELSNNLKNIFYGRSSLRQVPKLERTSLGKISFDFKNDSDRPRLFIDRDERFENDIENVTSQILQAVFNSNIQTKEIRDSFIEPINAAFERIFGTDTAISLRLKQFSPPLDGEVASILFQKGDSEIHYNLLSAGEKEVFNILINLLSRRDIFNDTIYFFDEIDLHLNTKLQFNLIKEITEHWMPENCQFWTASHSLGFIEYANQSENAALIDLDELNFDVPQTILPTPKNTLDVYEIAVPKKLLATIFSGKQIVICENQNDKYFNSLGLKNKIFVGVLNNNAVFVRVKEDANLFGLRDRDFLTNTEIERLEKHYPHYRILRFYNFENYIYHPDNLAELVPNFDIIAYKNAVIHQKNEKADYIISDFKRARTTYLELKEDKMKDTEDGINTIITDLRSDDFDRFYRYFDMKNQFNKKGIEHLNLSKEALVSTVWFKDKMKEILK